MAINKLMVANRGEIAIRIMRAAAQRDIPSVAIYSEDDSTALHRHKADTAQMLQGRGAAAYLDGAQIIALAKQSGCDAIHPGYGFLSENADFAQACAQQGITFVGPTAEQLALFGDKIRARALALETDVPLLPGTSQATSAAGALDFMQGLGAGAAIMIKAIAGGGGRGMRAVTDIAELESAYQRCQSEALSAFGNGDVYVEQLLTRARHIEVQIIGDGSGAISHVYERECSLQRRNQKLVEVAPSPSLPVVLREKLLLAATRMAAQANYQSLGTFEFLLDDSAKGLDDNTPFFFMEANPRVQVEHTVTEEVTGIDLVQTQLAIAGGESLAQLGLSQAQIPSPRGYAVQLRINMETMNAQGEVKPSGGCISAFEAPSGLGIRNDGYGYAGYNTNPSFDSMLGKLIAYSPSGGYKAALDKAYRALCEYRIEGVATNIGLLQNLIRQEAVRSNSVYTKYVEDQLTQLVSTDAHQQLFVPTGESAAVVAQQQSSVVAPLGSEAVAAPMQGTIVAVDVVAGAAVSAGQQVLVMEAMKMEHVITAPCNGIVAEVTVVAGDTIFEDHALLFVLPQDVEGEVIAAQNQVELDFIRPDLAEVIERHGFGLDENRPDAVARRRKTGHRTARENIDDLCDEGTFIEYGALAIAAQRRRREIDELIRRTPADGMIAGVGGVNGEFIKDSRCVLMSYDYTVLAGTQGMKNHFKKDRMFEIAEQHKLPVVFYAEGGGGRPGDTDGSGVSGLDCMAFYLFGKLSGTVPLVGITTGRCFAGNAALLGCCDVIIATKGSNIGMGGPSMIEGGGLGIFKPEDVGPMAVQTQNGVVDVAVEDEAEATAVAKQYVGYFQGDKPDWQCADQRELRHIIPENRLRIYEIREVLEKLCDSGSVLELRKDFGPGMITAFARIEGKPIGIVGNNPGFLAGAIDSDGADKASRFMQLCNNFGIPIVFLCDTPGIMVGPEAEKTATVRHAARMFVAGANLTVPFFSIILRKCYGLGAQAMAGGSFKLPFFSVAWPTGEFGPMGLEGAVTMGYRRELEAIDDLDERAKYYQSMVDRMYKNGRAVNVASHFEIDDVIDPSDTRRWIVQGLSAVPRGKELQGQQRSFVDTW